MVKIGRTPREGARLCPHDEVSLDAWRAIGGIPDDRSTVEAAVEIMFKLWDALQTANQTMVELADAIGVQHDALQRAEDAGNRLAATCRRIAADESGVWGSGYGAGLDEVLDIWDNRYENDPRNLAREEA